MRTLVTGGTGFIGSRLALACLNSAEEVVVLGQVNNPAEEQNRKILEARGAAIQIGSVTDREAVKRALDGVRLVFHLAAAQHESNVPDRHFWEVNVEGTRNLLEASIRAGVERFVHGSTIGVYGAAMAGEIGETTPLKPDNIYGLTKSKGEALALSHADRLPVTVIRISETYGPGDRRLLKLFRAIDRKVFFMIGRGDNKHQLTYIDDLVEGLRRAARAPEAAGQGFVLAGPEVLTTREMVGSIARALGVRAPAFPLPMWPFLLAAVLLETILRPLGIQPPLHRRRMDFFRKSFFFDRSKSREVLGFEPSTPFDRGAELTASWYRENGYL